MRGVRFNIMDSKIIPDPAHRKDGIIADMARKAFHGAMLAAEPILQEPIFLCEIQAHDNDIGNIYQLMGQRRGAIISEEPLPGSPIVNL